MTQRERVLQYIDDFGSIDSLQAFKDLGVTRLASRIYELKKHGVEIDSFTKTGTNRYGDPVHYSVYRRPENA